MRQSFLISILLIFSTSMVLAARTSPFIIGGEDARVGEIPFMVSIHSSSGHFCGGSLIAKNWVLTAGHCMRGETLNSIKKIYVGLHNQKATEAAEAFNPLKIVVHPEHRTVNFDYALVQLDGYSSHTPIEINNADIRVKSNQNSMLAVAAGWGLLRENSWSGPDVLRKVTLPLVTKETCLRSYPGKITDQMLCAGFPEGGKDSCQMDSGGPLFALRNNRSPILIGVVSWGQGCARPQKYGVYSKVSAAFSWIQEVIQ